MNLLPIVTGWFPWTVNNERLGVEELCCGVLPVKERGKPGGRGRWQAEVHTWQCLHQLSREWGAKTAQ